MRSDAQGAADIDWLMLVGNYAERLWQSIDIADWDLAQKVPPGKEDFQGMKTLPCQANLVVVLAAMTVALPWLDSPPAPLPHRTSAAQIGQCVAREASSLAKQLLKHTSFSIASVGSLFGLPRVL